MRPGHPARIAILAALLCAPAIAAGQVGEVVANAHTTSNQDAPDIGADAKGNTVVVWNSLNQDGSFNGVFGRRFNASGAPIGGEFQVNTTTAGSQLIPRVAVAPAGSFLVVWFGPGDGSGDAILGRLYDASGVAVGSEFVVNATTAGSQAFPDVAADASGNFVVVWEGPGDGNGTGVLGRRFSSSAMPLAGDFVVNATVAGNQFRPAVARYAEGGFVVAWQSNGQDGDLGGIFAQVFASDGMRVGAELPVNTTTAGVQQGAAIAVRPGGGFIVMWESDDGAGLGIFAQLFQGIGIPEGGEYRVNAATAGAQSSPAIEVGADGSFLASWTELVGGLDPSGSGVVAGRLDPDGNPLGKQFRVNNHTSGAQLDPAVASDPRGDFIVAWADNSSPGPDFDGYGVHFRRFKKTFCAGRPVTLQGTRHDDLIEGTAFYDVIHAKPGNDVVNGLGGDDVICGSGGNDTLNGGSNDDVLRGGAGADNLDGGLHTDACRGGPGPETVTNCE